MERITLNYTYMSDVISDEAFMQIQPEVEQALRATLEKTGAGRDFLGWVSLPHEIPEALLQDIQQTADALRAKSDVIISIGIGGSYLGARAVIEAVQGPLAPYHEATQVLYAGHNISSWYMQDLLTFLEKKDFSLIVISKSGTTTEPALAFRILRDALEKCYGKEEAGKRIVAITDKAKGALKQLANDEGYKTFIIPDDVGGRFSVLTPVGLLPIACAGISIQEFIKGFRAMASALTAESSLKNNPALAYAAIRTLLYRQGKQIEILVNFEPALHYVSEWWKQLFGESEGKDGKALFPASVDFTTDLHSMGQLIQDGVRNLFETFIIVNKNRHTVTVPHDESNLDTLNYLEGKNLNEINFSAYQGTALAHKDGGAPSMTIELPELTPYYLGQLLYFFEIAVAVSGYLLKVNPFDQPGVEAYKKNMFALLGKPGVEQATHEIHTRLERIQPKHIVTLEK
ncbi:glucose-6-phosphate isomerase [Candidatus Vecturithrix granuli]|uniref:Glucose-6-phosphate isomerase n=1 Tax=Vecturithrix granuli TaxID=1499967 RepID=A0A081C4E9_VECG1|nr:glucose-6-phosphate isomerase [Candidatus Vecturithrix granuli]